MKTITELAREAGATAEYLKHYDTFIARFAALVRAAALEEAAGVCDNSASYCRDDGLLQLVLKSNAAAIRQLKETK